MVSSAALVAGNDTSYLPFAHGTGVPGFGFHVPSSATSLPANVTPSLAVTEGAASQIISAFLLGKPATTDATTAFVRSLLISTTRSL